MRGHLECCNHGLQLSGVLLVSRTSMSWKNIITYCVILHNMVIKDEREMPDPIDYECNGTPVKPHRHIGRIQAFFEVYRKLKTGPPIIS